MFKTSQSIAKVSAAINEAQKLIKFAKKDSSNPFFKSKYADIAAVIDASKEALNNNGITILQPHRTETVVNEGNILLVDYVDTILLHTSGEYIMSSTRVEVAKKNDPQALGSGITYSRRYGLQSLISLPVEDDDGEGAMNRTTSSFSKAAPKAAATETKAATTAEPKAAATGARQKFRRQAVTTSSSTGDSHDI